jgi:hypothetical protein
MFYQRLVKILITSLSLSIFAPLTLPITQAQAEVVEVGLNQDCPGGNAGWRRDQIDNVIRCTRVATPTSTSETSTATPSATASATPAP